jgi:hypothetical protein
MSEKFRKPCPEEQAVLASLQVRLIESHELGRCNRLLDHIVTGPQGEWLALLIRNCFLPRRSTSTLRG